jgi:hypothetical protein
MTFVHVVRTEATGEPLVGPLADHREQFGLDEGTFHERSPVDADRPDVRDLERRGAILSTDADRRARFESLGHAPKQEAAEVLWPCIFGEV